MVTKSRNSKFRLSLGLAIFLLTLAGCGGGSKTNVVRVDVSPTNQSVIVSQSLTLAAIVTGTTNTNVTWMCQYETTTTDTNGKPVTGSKTACTSETGNIPANSSDTTVVFTAPSTVPDPRKLAGNNCTSASQPCVLSIIVTATSAADPKKSNFATLSLDSGIVVTLTPATATVPTSSSAANPSEVQFTAALTNDLQGLGVTWLVTQGTPTSSTPYPSLPTCTVSGNASGCGSIDANGKYAAPTAIPSTATLKVVAASKADPTRFAVGTITVIQGGPITFKGISPTIAPAGASFYDIYIDAPFFSSLSSVTLTKQDDQTVTPINSASGQIKVLFPIPTTTVTNPGSTGARLRLNAQNLSKAGTYQVAVLDASQCPASGCPVSATHGPLTFQVVPVRPTSVASLPDSIPLNGSANERRLTIDGGYFGPTGNLAVTTFNGTSLAQDTNSTSASRQLNLIFPSSVVSSSLPGLYPLSVSSTTLPAPTPNNPSVTNIALFPDYSTIQPAVVGAGTPAGSNPGAVDVDTHLGILAVAETGSDQVQFFSIGSGSLTLVPGANGTVSVNKPSGLSVNQSNHTVAVVSFQDQSVKVFRIPDSSGNFPTGSGAAGVTYPLTISLAGLIPSNFTPAPLAYSIGVDPDTNNALVAYSSSATPTTAKVGFLLDLSADTQTCLPSLPNATPPCIHAQVTLNTGRYPQIAMIPHAHQALVTPGGTGVIQGIDVTKSSSSFAISNISVTSGLVTVTLTIPSGETLSLNPGNPGSVLIQGVPPGTQHNTNFNGVFTIQNVLNSNSFIYALNSTQNDSVSPDPSTDFSFAFFSSPNITVVISQTTQGIAINPITRTAAIADANATGINGPQIDLLNSLDQSISSITFHAGCTVFSSTCSNAPELLGTSSVAFQPYTNSLVSYNPQQGQVSVSNPVTLGRYTIVPVGNPNEGIATVPVTVNGASANLNLFGGLAVDPATNQAFVSQSGTGKIQIVNLVPDPSDATHQATLLKSAQITELQVPPVSGALVGGIAGASMPQGTLTSGSALQNVQIFGSGFDSGTQVRLDSTALPSGNVQFVSSRNLKVTIPASFLSAPHRYAVDVLTGGNIQSNATDFFVIKSVDMKTACSGGNPLPSSVAIADQLPGQAFSPIAVVSNSGCNNVSLIDINPQSATFGTIKSSIATGGSPRGVAASPRFGLAVVANSTDGTASVLDLVAGTQKVAAVTVGTTPTGVAIDEGTGAALITNTGNNTVSRVNLALLFGSSPPTSLSATSIAVDTSPIAVAIDPDRGTNNLGLAVVTALQLVSGSAPIGVFDSIDIGVLSPAKSTTAFGGSVTSTPTGVVFNTSVSPTLFYATSSGGNVVTTFNPDNGQTTSVHVGINPTSLALNPQTGGIMTVNSASQTVSIIDTLSNPFKTRSTFGLGGSPQFGVAIDQFTNLAVLADQANQRVLIFPVPN